MQVIVIKSPTAQLRTDISLLISSNNLNISIQNAQQASNTSSNLMSSSPPALTQRSTSSSSVKESIPPAKPSKSATMPVKTTHRPTTTITSPVSASPNQRPVSTWISTTSHPPKPNAPPPTLGGQRGLPANMNRNSSEPQATTKAQIVSQCID